MSKPIKVAHLTSAHPDGDVRIFHKECVTLAKAGYNVSMILPGTTTRNEKGVHIISFPSVPGSRLLRAIRTVNAVFAEALKINADIYHLHDPELLRIAIKLKRKGKIVIYDAHEDLPRQVLAKSYIPKFLRKTISRWVEKYENRKVSGIDGVVAATPFIRDRFLKINKNSVDINNYPILEELDSPVDFNLKSANEICYVGNITVVRGVKEIVQSLPGTKARLLLAGKFEDSELKANIEREPGWKQVEYFGFVDRQQVKDVYRRARAGLVTLYPIINYLDALPVKMFEYMAAGIPVIASDFPLWKQIIEDNNCGLCVSPKDPKALAAAINALLNDEQNCIRLGHNGKQAVRNKFNWTIESEKLIAFYQGLIKKNRA